MSGCGRTDRKYAVRPIQCSTVSCVEINGSRALAVYVNIKCRERLRKRVVFVFNSATSQQGHGTAALASHGEAILESLSRNNAAAV